MISFIAVILGVVLMALNATPPPYPSKYRHSHGFETLVATGLFTSPSHAHYTAHSTTIDRAAHDRLLLNEIARFNLTQPRDELPRPMVPFKAISLSPTTLQIVSDTFEEGWDLEYANSQSGSFDSDDAVTFSSRQILAFAKDGLKMFLVGRVSGGGGSERTIISWNLSQAGDIDTAIYNNDAFIYYENSAHQDMVFNKEGTQAWFVGADSSSGQNSIYEYSLTTAWDVSTLTAGTIFNIGANASTLASAIEISPDGVDFFVADEFTNLIRHWKAITPFAILGAIEQVDVYDLINQETDVTGIAFRDDGCRMFITGRNTDRIFQFELGTAWDLNSVEYNDVSQSAPFTNPTSLSFADDEFGVSGMWELFLDGDNGEMTSRKRGGPFKLFKSGGGAGGLPAFKSGGNIRKTFTEVSGLEDFEGVCLGIGGLGVVANGSPQNQLCATTSPNCVTDGKITLCNRASRLHVGWRYISDVETLDIETQSGTVQGKIKRIPSVTIRFKKSRLGLVGPDKFHLTTILQRDQEAMGQPTTLLTGDKQVKLEPQWNSHGRIFYRQLDPLPFTILAIIPDLNLEDGPDD